MSVKKKIAEWKKYYWSLGLPDSLINEYILYIEIFLYKNLPVIFEFNHLSSLLGKTSSYLASVINCPKKHYRDFYIPKRRGGKRLISAPYPALLECQRWINKEILSKYKIHPAIHGYTIGRSIKSNAMSHLKCNYLLKMDLKDFFPSIKLNRVVSLFIRLGYPPNVSYYLASLCCCNGCLPQGGATSPTISNIVTNKLDTRLDKLSSAWGLKYTRYADDITLSGEYINYHFINLVQTIIKEEGFEVNEAKTTLIRPGGKKIVTGLILSDETVNVTREFKRKLRQELYYITKYGVISHVAKKKIRDPFYLDSLYGKLNFWKWVEPENKFVIDHLYKIQDFKNKVYSDDIETDDSLF